MLLRSVFTLFSGIGPRRAHLLRARGCTTWSDLLADARQMTLFSDPLTDEIAAAEEAHQRQDVAFFYARLPRRLVYLLALDFPDKVTFLDIEATGLSRIYHEVTLVGLGQGEAYRFLLAGRGGVSREVSDSLLQRPLVVTFNGTLYDLPFLHSRLALPPLYGIDLRYLAFRLGFSGSQKRVEEALGLHRPPQLRGMVGEDAPALWFRAVRGDLSAMRRLINYNYEDVRGLSRLLSALSARALTADGLPARLRARDTPAPARKPSLPQDTLKSLIRSVASDASPLLRVNPSGPSRRVVGLDLTGSAERLSGAAIMTIDNLDVATLGTDEAILEYVRAAAPDLVSIDAPLSLPAGRSRVTDDDPARQSAGIMRVAERELKRRGVNVYPCLLPSMQRLTERGMNLAARLRSEGVPVIECYPGAAQDMLSMPRKGVGVDYLRQSLKEIGLDLPKRKLSHDELDAITAAIVGMLFLDSRYELLGTEQEEPMVVPRIQPREDLPRAIIVVTGPIAAGKTTLGALLARQGWAYARYSAVISDEVERRGLRTSREVLQRVGEDLKAVRGQRWIGRRVVEAVRGAERIVIDGARFLEDIAFLREEYAGRICHVHVDAPQKLREDRSRLLGVDPSAFRRAEMHPVEQQTRLLAECADQVVANVGTMDDFERAALRLVVPTCSVSKPLFIAVEPTAVKGPAVMMSRGSTHAPAAGPDPEHHAPTESPE